MVAWTMDGLQLALRSAAQSSRWTYSLFWHLCPQQGCVLVCVNGYYNGPIKTRKTVQGTMEVSADEAAIERSQQLRELYESLSAGEASQASARRPVAALSPEDLTETEWFYLLCVSFSFAPGIGLPGKAFAKRVHVWLTGANDTDCRVFSRSILAKSAGIQTIVCIPHENGVLELGSTEKVEEDIHLIEHAKSFFTGHLEYQTIPLLSEHSVSNTVACTNQPLFQSRQPLPMIQRSVDPHGSSKEEEEDDDDDDNDDDVDTEEGDDDGNHDDQGEAGSDSEVMTERYCADSMHHNLSATDAAIQAAELSELMELEMSEGIRVGSPDSNNLNSETQTLSLHHINSQQQDGSYQAWPLLDEALCTGFPQLSGPIQIQDLSPEDAYYTETVSFILRRNTERSVNLSSISYIAHSRESAFSKWHEEDPESHYGKSQWVLKYILFSVPTLHCKYKDENIVSSPNSGEREGGNRFRKGTQHGELSASHVLAERRRREKLNERFIILRSLIPFVTKMDKASILGDTIEYVKKLRRQIQDLEAQNKKEEINERSKRTRSQRPHKSKDQIQTNISFPHKTDGGNRVFLSEKRKLRTTEGGTGIAKDTREVESSSINVQVSIIETDALLELRCPYKDGILLKIMQTLDELRLEVTSVQSSSANGVLVAELRAKVKEVNGKKPHIVEVKKAIYHIFSQYSF